LKRTLAFILLTACPAAAQAPRATVVETPLTPNAGNDFFLRGKNLYDAAQAPPI
jgi:hypothetical protein